MIRSDPVLSRVASAMAGEKDCIDVFVPTHPKDFPALPLCIHSLRKVLQCRSQAGLW